MAKRRRRKKRLGTNRYGQVSPKNFKKGKERRAQRAANRRARGLKTNKADKAGIKPSKKNIEGAKLGVKRRGPRIGKGAANAKEYRGAMGTGGQGAGGQGTTAAAPPPVVDTFNLPDPRATLTVPNAPPPPPTFNATAQSGQLFVPNPPSQFNLPDPRASLTVPPPPQPPRLPFWQQGQQQQFNVGNPRATAMFPRSMFNASTNWGGGMGSVMVPNAAPPQPNMQQRGQFPMRQGMMRGSRF